MYPRLYRKPVQTRFCLALVLLALTLRLLPQADEACRAGLALLRLGGSRPVLNAVLLLETGLGPRAETADKPAPLPRPLRTPPGAQASGIVPNEAPETETAAPEPPAEPETTALAPEPSETAQGPVFSAAAAQGLKLRGSCSYQPDLGALLEQPLPAMDAAGPRVLIVHTHSTEAYTPDGDDRYEPSGEYRTLEDGKSVIAVGDVLAEELEALGVTVIHDRTLNDYPSYNDSYANAREKIRTWLDEYPSIRMVLDLHRDALAEPVRETAELDGTLCAPMMLVVGTDEGGLSHPDWQRNLSLALKLQVLGLQEGGGLMKPLDLRKERFNQDLSPGALIVEIGSTENTLEEAKRSAAILARMAAELIG